jgi:hypothetical protein
VDDELPLEVLKTPIVILLKGGKMTDKWVQIEINNILFPWEINSTGEARNIHTKRIKSRKRNIKTGYYSYEFGYNKKNYSKYIHRLVAQYFLSTFDPSLTVNHIDGDKSNNDLSNLECLTVKDNVRHGFKTGLFDAGLSPVDQYDLFGNFISSFKTITEASASTGIDIGKISACAMGKYSHTSRIQWRRLGESPPPDISKTGKMHRTKVRQLTLDGEEVKIHKNLKEAYEHINKTNNGLLSMVCKGMRKTAHGYKWEYVY